MLHQPAIFLPSSTTSNCTLYYSLILDDVNIHTKTLTNVHPAQPQTSYASINNVVLGISSGYGNTYFMTSPTTSSACATSSASIMIAQSSRYFTAPPLSLSCYAPPTDRCTTPFDNTDDLPYEPKLQCRQSRCGGQPRRDLGFLLAGAAQSVRFTRWQPRPLPVHTTHHSSTTSRRRTLTLNKNYNDDD